MSERFPKALVSGATIPMALVSDEGRILAASPPWERLLGPELAFASCFAPADRSAVAQGLVPASGGDRPGVDARLQADTSKWVNLQATPVPDDGALLVVASDVTNVRADLDEQRARVTFMEWQALSLSTFAKALEQTRVVLFSMDPAGVTTMSDGKGLELLGQKPGERVGKNELEATAGTPIHGFLRRALAGETVRALVEPAPGVHFDTCYMPLRDEQNRQDGVLGLAVDATDRVRSEQKLEEKMAVIARQSETIRHLFAPILKVWEGVLCMPIIGTVDSARAGEMMSHLLEAIVREKARFAILDLTGVETMDTSTVDHMLRIFAAVRTVGACGVLSGVRPAVANTLVSLGVDLSGLRMMRTLHDALAWSLDRRGLEMGRQGGLSALTTPRRRPAP